MESIAGRVEPQAVPGTYNRRRRYIVNAAFQWRVVLTIALFVFFATSIISSVLFGVLHGQARARYMDPTGYTADVPLVFIGFGLAFSLLAALAVGGWCVVFTHRICGPLTVMKGWCEELAAGGLPHVRPFRKNDEFKELHEAFAKAVGSIVAQRRKVSAGLSESLAIAESARSTSQSEQAAALNRLVQELRVLHGALAERPART